MSKPIDAGTELATDVAIVGAGPAGTALALLLARRGLDVTLIERQEGELGREPRTDGLQPSGMQALAEMGLGEAVARLPRADWRRLELWRDGRRALGHDFEPAGFGVSAPLFVSMPALLELLAAEAARHPGFRLWRGCELRDLALENERVAGVCLKSADGDRLLRARLVIGTDGRASTVRRRAGISVSATEQQFDIVWLTAPSTPLFPAAVTRIEVTRGRITSCMCDAEGRLAVAWVTASGDLAAFERSGGWLDGFLADASPDLAGHLNAVRAELPQRPTVLDVRCDLALEWTRPGLLLLGDAAHAMSPVGGQGTNMALRDAVVAANRLGPVLAAGGDAVALDVAAEAIADERSPEIEAMQQLQTSQARIFLQPDAWLSRVLFTLLPLGLRTGFLNWLLRERRERMAHGYTDVHLS